MTAHTWVFLPQGTYVRGLHLENAGWDKVRGCLKSAEIGELTTPFPVVAVTAVEKVPDRLPVSGDLGELSVVWKVVKSIRIVWMSTFNVDSN